MSEDVYFPLFFMALGGVSTVTGWAAWTGRWRGWTRSSRGMSALGCLPGGLMFLCLGASFPLGALWEPAGMAVFLFAFLGPGLVAGLIMFVGPFLGSRWYPRWYHELPPEEQVA